MRNVRRLVGLALAVPAIVLSMAVGSSAQTSGSVVELHLDGVVDPFIARYVTGGIAAAADAGAAAVLLTIDTPGGLDSSMREIVQAISNSDVPVIGYVSPDGARAASAGTFILLACPIAAMAPSTNVGAAHPVGLSGAIESEKATNDAAAYIRGIAESHGRNATWAEQAVRDSVSISARQALDENVIDLIAPTTGALLDEVDGMTVALNVGDVIVHTAGARIEELHMGAFSSFLHALLDPNLAFLFFWFGLALLALELFVPGGIAGTVGALMLVASLVALGMLPVQLIGVALLVASVVFFVLELVHPGIGLPTAGGVITLVLGGWFLFDASVPGVRVSPFVIVPVAGLAVLFFGFVIQQAIRLRRRRGETRIDTLVGREGVVLRDLAPSGVVQLASEEWSAEVVSGSAAKGDPVRVVAVDGLRLKVEPIAQEAPTGSASEGGSP